MLNSGLKDLRDHFETLFRECERSVGFACPGVDHGRIKDDSEIAMHNFKGTDFIDMSHLLMWAYNMGLYWKAIHQNENRPRGFVTIANNLITTKYFFVQDMFSSEQQCCYSTIDSPSLLTQIFGTYELEVIEFTDSGVPFLKILGSFSKTFSRMLNESSQKLSFVCTKRFVTTHLLVSQLKFSLWHGQFGQKGKTKN